MLRRSVLHFLMVSVASICGLCAVPVLEAAKPGPTPPPPPDPATIWEYRPDLGGWLDKQKNLVWGYNLYELTGSFNSFNGAQLAAPNYAASLFAVVDRYEDSAEYQLIKADEERALGDAAYAAGNLELAAYYYDREARRRVLAEENFESADIALVDAANAAQFTNWRLPTKDEAVDASSKKLFSADSTGLVRYDSSPYVGQQAIVHVCWTSTQTGPANKNAYVWGPWDGGFFATGKSSAAAVIVVRKHTP